MALGGYRELVPLDGAEALMWAARRDPLLSSAFITVTLLDGTPDHGALRSRLAGAVEETDRLRRRIVVPGGLLQGPAWEEDPDFDLDNHLRRAVLPPPGTLRQLLDMAASEVEGGLDAERPPWRVTVVDGLEGPDGESAALLAHLGHVLTDGEGGLRLSSRFLDLDEAGTARASDALDRSRPAARRAPLPAGDGWSRLSALALGLWRGIVPEAPAPASRLVETVLGREPLQVAASLGRQLVVVDRSRSGLWRDRRSLRRRFEVASFDLDRVHRAGRRLRGTVNDAYVTAVVGGIAAYHRRFEAPLPDLRVAVPVSTREPGTTAANAFFPLRVVLPAGDEGPLSRFAAVHEALDQAKAEPGLGAVGGLSGLLAFLPPPLLTEAARRQASTVDVAISNVSGSPVDLFVGGARIRATYPLGPTVATALNATVLSYRSRLDMGLSCDAAAVDEPEALRDCITAAMGALCEAAGV
ncbi:MAG: wax ester/triacylglycerol synthase domain-containing protein, partial [Acidimicrobiales bacterium]